MSTKIEWTDKTWNPIIGCSKTSEACEHCYAERMAARLANNPATPWYKTVVTEDGKWNGTGALVSHLLDKPRSWRKPCRVFVGSMTDMFHESMPDEWLDKVFDVIADTPHITYQILTKRPERMKKYMEGCERGAADIGGVFPWPNVWLGVTVENQAQADSRIPVLLETPAAIRYVSVEPLLGPISLDYIECTPFLDGEGADYYTALRGYSHWRGGDFGINGPALDWVICGGETGHGARQMHEDWACDLLMQCESAGVPFFFKKWGNSGREKIGGQIVREFPTNVGG